MLFVLDFRENNSKASDAISLFFFPCFGLKSTALYYLRGFGFGIKGKTNA